MQEFFASFHFAFAGHIIQLFDETVPLDAVQLIFVMQGVEQGPTQFKLFERILIP